MSNVIKTASFNKSDLELVKQIEVYQHKKQYDHFIDAVRKLCETSLKIQEINNTK